MKLDLNAQELKVLVGLLDAGVKAMGLRAVAGAAHLLGKLEQAKQAEDEPDTTAPDKEAD